MLFPEKTLVLNFSFLSEHFPKVDFSLKTGKIALRFEISGAMFVLLPPPFLVKVFVSYLLI